MARQGFSEDTAPFKAAEPPPTGFARVQLRIGDGGRVVIPADMRAALGVKPGDTLVARVVDGELSLMSQKSAVRRAQQLVRRFVPEGVSLVDELIAERRAEAARETQQ
ncbi:MAG: AbrB/MazE/SpoVT family DNA-binding domain-containing protein [Mesorhizobium sp.]|nr:AbrB/MazE/SpoVT family DNA-binding domain-containing protein [Mesorhizobium sp.]